MKKPEFDDFVKNYRKKQDKHLWLSGESSEFFAEYKAYKMAEWLFELKFKENKILDFGSGDGLMTYYVSRFFSNSKLFGCDISQNSVDISAKNYPEIEFKIIKDKIPYKENYFDIAFSAGVFHHIKFDEHENWFFQIFKSLKKGGQFILFELNPFNPATFYTFKNHPMEKNAKMLSAFYSKKILSKFGKAKLKFYCFFPKLLKSIRFLEPCLTWLPLGALYAVIVKKN